MTEEMRRRWQNNIAGLTVIIGEKLGMSDPEMNLMMMHLNTPRKIKRFSDWMKTKEEGETITATIPQVLSAATRIGRGWEPLD